MHLLKQRLPRFSVLRSPFSLICASALLLAGALEVWAKTIRIDGSITNQQNGGQELRAGDTIIVTKNGSITIRGTTSFFSVLPISAPGRNTITNAGEINTSGGTLLSSRPAILARDSNTISNTGKINTTGPAANGIRVNDLNINPAIKNIACYAA